jgi:hypothetical protein
MTRWLVLLVMVACACPNKQTAGPGTGSDGSAGSGGAVTPPVTNANTCDEVKPRIEKLYRAEGQAKEPKRVEDYVADNTAMVMADCAKDPARFVPCISAAPTVAELEKQCTVPLDEEGTEGDAK